MNLQSIGEKIGDARRGRGFTQLELAEKCNLNVRTVQRIEAGMVSPRQYTLRLLSEALETDFLAEVNGQQIDHEMQVYHMIFKRRKRIRISISIVALALLTLVLISGFSSWEILGLSKRTWAPFLYGIFFFLLILIGLTWRCPSCNAILGDPTNTRHCSKCGLQLDE